MVAGRDKIVGQFRLRLCGVLKPFNTMGLGVFIGEAIDSIVEQAFVMHERLKEEEEEKFKNPQVGWDFSKKAKV